MHTLVKACPCALVAAVGLFVAASGAGAAEPVVADDPLNYAGPARKQDEMFLLSTRLLGVPSGEVAPAFALARFNEKEQWEPISLEAFVAGPDARVKTLVYVHGYDFDEAKAERVGWAFYHAFCDDLPADERVRFVVWSWPTRAKRFRPVRDFIDKAHRSDADAYYLAWFLAQLPSDTRVGLAGSALGCQVAQGAMHLMGRGTMGDLQLALPDAHRWPRVAAVFIAPAVNNDWLYPGGYHDRAAAAASRLLLVNNPVDAALCRYGQPWKSKPVALGQSGLTDAEKLGELAKRIEQIDASEQIGEEHGVEHYLRSPELVARVRVSLLAP